MLKLNNLTGFGKAVTSGGGGGPTYDSDTQAFLTATGITDPTQAGALDTLVLALKSASVWTKMFAIYPFVGGSATKHKFNLKDPRDLDAAFRIVWNGTLTHDANGVTSDGSSGYGDTKLQPSSVIPSNSGSAGVWIDDTTGVNQVPLGVQTTTSVQITQIIPHWSDGTSYPAMNGAQGAFSYSGSGANLIQVVRTDGTNCFYQQATSRTSFTGSYNAPTHLIYIGALNNAGSPAFYYSNNPIKFAYIGDTLTTTDTDNIYSAVAAYQSSLSR